nr:GNAT family N-acetyltransferase [Aridibaculum aurantiacum]
MKIEHEASGNGGKFFIVSDNKQIAKMLYNVEDNSLQIYSTEVDKEHREQNLAGQMVEQAVAYATEKEWKIVPICSFAKAFIQKRPDLQHIL